MIKELVYPSNTYANAQPRVSWGAVIAGALFTTALMMLFGVLGLGIGLVSSPGVAGAAGVSRGLGIGTGIWGLVTGIISFYCGGWVAGRLTSIGRVSESVIHGLLSWSLASLFMGYLIAGAGGILTARVGVTAQAAGAFSIFAFIVMGLELAAAAYGARAGTRVYVPSSASSRRAAESVETR